VIDKATGEARSAVVPNIKAGTLRKAMERELEINLGASTLHTDSARHYVTLAATTKGPRERQPRRGRVRPQRDQHQQAEGFFSQLKRSIDGTHHHVSIEHLHRYLAQFDWLYTHCRASDSERLRTLVGNVGGRRLTYRPLRKGADPKAA
jgi:transposase-like protein